MVQSNNKSISRCESIALQHILKAIRGMRFGTVTLIVQDGLVIQIDQTEKTRIDYSSDTLQEDGGGI